MNLTLRCSRRAFIQAASLVVAFGMLISLTAETIAAPADKSAADFPGSVRLALPHVIYAVPGIETNIYFDNVVLVVNPANYIFDVSSDMGFQYDERWTYTPQPSEVGDHPIMLEVRDESNAVIARARSTIHVAQLE